MGRLVKDKRGRVRFTIAGTRYEVNKRGELRCYRRYSPFPDAERKQSVVDVKGLGRDGRNLLWEAIYLSRHPELNRAV